MFKDSINEELFAKSMQNLKTFSKSYDEILSELTKFKEKENKRIKNRIKKEGFAGVIVNSYVAHKRQSKNRIIGKKIKNEVNNTTPNYFSNHRIAVYTVVFGNYDNIREPVFIPDNCDYYIVTDQDIPDNSIWKKVDISRFDSDINILTNKEKNLFFRSHPDLLFSEYEYSIYIDGNVMPITDLTELINYLGNCGIGIFWHPGRQCIYDECRACMYFGMISSEQGEKHIEYLETNQMPHNYGLLETCVIARKHNLDICKKVMNDWWNEFMHTPRRDQLSLTYVLYKNGITVDEVAFPCGFMKDHGGVARFRHK